MLHIELKQTIVQQSTTLYMKNKQWMKWSLNHVKVILILIVEANFYDFVWNTLPLFCVILLLTQL